MVWILFLLKFFYLETRKKKKNNIDILSVFLALTNVSFTRTLRVGENSYKTIRLNCNRIVRLQSQHVNTQSHKNVREL